MQELNKRLNELNEKIMTKKIINRRIRDLETEISNKNFEISEFDKELQKEKRDVEKLKSFTLTNLFASMTGSKDEKLSKEEYELYRAKVKNDRLLFELNELIRTRDFNQSELVEIERMEKEYQELLLKKKDLIKDVSVEFKQIFDDKNNEVNAIKQQIIEINEALSAGRHCLNSALKSKKILDSARNWGTADIFMSKSLFTSMIKHEKITEASQIISITKRYVNEYQKELKDVNIDLDTIDLEFSGVMKTFDIFFDNIFTDFSVQGKINNAIDKINSIITNVEVSLSNLENMKSVNEGKLNSIESELNETILKYT